MVKREEIAHAADLIKIDLEEHEKYFEQVEKILSYFDILNKANIEFEDLVTQVLPIEKLREDRYIVYGEKLIEKLKNYKGTFIEAPKMI